MYIVANKLIPVPFWMTVCSMLISEPPVVPVLHVHVITRSTTVVEEQMGYSEVLDTNINYFPCQTGGSRSGWKAFCLHQPLHSALDHAHQIQ